jgi:hypothetical protein
MGELNILSIAEGFHITISASGFMVWKTGYLVTIRVNCLLGTDFEVYVDGDNSQTDLYLTGDAAFGLSEIYGDDDVMQSIQPFQATGTGAEVEYTFPILIAETSGGIGDITKLTGSFSISMPVVVRSL